MLLLCPKKCESWPRIFEEGADVSLRSLIFRALLSQTRGENLYLESDVMMTY